MRIKLILPRVTMRPMDSAWKTRMSPPLSLLVLAALTPDEHEVTLALISTVEERDNTNTVSSRSSEGDDQLLIAEPRHGR